MNIVILCGNVGKDPDVKTLTSEAKVAEFSLATSKKRKATNGDIIEDTQWHRIKCWNKLAEIAEKYVRKGSKLLIEGEIEYRKFTDNSGQERTVTEIRADKIEMVGAKQAGDSQPSKYEPSEPTSSASDDMPF